MPYYFVHCNVDLSMETCRTTPLNPVFFDARFYAIFFQNQALNAKHTVNDCQAYCTFNIFHKFSLPYFCLPHCFSIHSLFVSDDNANLQMPYKMALA